MIARFRQRGTLLLFALLLSGCVTQPEHQSEGDYAKLKSWMEILTINGESPKDPYEARLLPGIYHLKVLYKTYRKDYLCYFEFEAVAGRSYEIVDHSNTEPLVLYRWRRVNGLWAERTDPIKPDCS